MDSEKHVISLLVDNRTGVLSRVVGLFGRRGFNIDSLTVSATDHPEVSRITILVHGDAAILRQIILQTDRLEETREVFALESADSLFRELLLLKVEADASNVTAALINGTAALGP